MSIYGIRFHLNVWGLGAGGEVNSWDPGVEVGEDFVGDGMGVGGEFVGGDGLVLLGAEEDDFVAIVGGAVGAEVDHDLVHADAPDDGVALTANEGVGAIGEGAEIAVAIADGEGDDAGVAIRGPGGAVADGVAGFDDFEVNDVGFEGEGGGDGEGAGAFGGGIDAVEEDAGADEIEVGFWELQDGAGVGDVAGGGGETVLGVEGEDFMEALELLAGVGEIGGVAIGEVRVDAFDVGVTEGEAGGEQFFGGIPMHADALHAGIDFQVDFGGGAEGGGGFVDEEEFLDGGGGEAEVVLKEKGDLLGADAAEDEDGLVDAGLAEGDAFFEKGDAEGVDAAVGEVLGGGDEAVAVGVGFDDGHHLGGADVSADGGEVGGEGGQVDLRAGEAEGIGWWGGIQMGVTGVGVRAGWAAVRGRWGGR
jgi:hypothetical protein